MAASAGGRDGPKGTAFCGTGPMVVGCGWLSESFSLDDEDSTEFSISTLARCHFALI